MKPILPKLIYSFQNYGSHGYSCLFILPAAPENHLNKSLPSPSEKIHWNFYLYYIN